MHADGLRLAPFRGLRYAPGRVRDPASVMSPPYDVVVRPEGLRELESADPHNIVRLVLPHAEDPAAGHRAAAATLRRWRADGVLVRDPLPALYVYEQRAPGLLQRGLIGALELTAAEAGVVLPHEEVIPSVVGERADLTRATGANLEPLLLSYRGPGASTGPSTGAAAVIERAAGEAPLVSFDTEDGVRHRLWAVTAHEAVAEATGDLSRRRAMIADGHHRWASCLRLRAEHGGRPPWNRGMVLLVDTARYPLRVRPIHRLVPWLTPAAARDRLGGAFRVRRLAGTGLDGALAALAAARGPAFVLAGAGAFHLVDRPDPALLARAVPRDRPRSWRELEAAVLHTAVLGPLWNAPPGAPALGYLHDAAAAVARAERQRGTAVLMRAVPEERVRALAERGVPLPQKSTSFGPKPVTGLVLRALDEAEEADAAPAGD